MKGTEIILLGSIESLEWLPYCIEIVFGQKLQLVKQYSLWKIKNKNSRGDLPEGWSGGFLVSQLTRSSSVISPTSLSLASFFNLPSYPNTYSKQKACGKQETWYRGGEWGKLKGCTAASVQVFMWFSRNDYNIQPTSDYISVVTLS